MTDARNNITTYTYNNMDRLGTRTDPLLHVETYNVYDGNGNLTQVTDRKSQVTNYTYDALNRRTGVTYADTSTTSYTYDAGNRLTQVVDSISGTITRAYDGLDRLTSETTPQGSVSYTYDNAGRRATMTVSGQPTTTYAYDNANRLTQITQGSSVVTFGYDAAGRRTSLTLPNGILVEYGYDAASRLISITYKQGTTVLGDLSYEYDKAGNRTKVGGSWARTGIPQAVSSTNYNASNQQLTFGDKTLTYDNNGNLTSITDSAGAELYTWNSRNQLAGISGPNVSASFVYDGIGRREKKTINGSLTESLYAGINPVQETSGVTVLANMLIGMGLDAFLARTDVPAGTTSSFLPDALGSAIALADSTSTVQSEYTYEPFGRATVIGASNTNPFQYTGRENDGTGLYYYRARYYNPALQRFVSEDPARLAGGGTNFYSYVLDSPTNFKDPRGLDWISSNINWNYVPGICNADSFRFYGGGLDDGNANAGGFHLDNVHYSNGPDGWTMGNPEPGVLYEFGSGNIHGGVVTDLSGRKPREVLFFLPLLWRASGNVHGELGLLMGYAEEGLALGYYGDVFRQFGPSQIGGGGGWSVTFSSVATCLQQMR